MIYTVTLNPSIDYIINVSNFQLGEVNRTDKELIYPGGKGINVSIVLNNLGIKNTALGFTAGFIGEEIKRLLKVEGINTDFIDVKNGLSRINVKLSSKEETEINGNGPNILDIDIENLMNKLLNLKEGDILVLAGSIPDSIKETMYSDISERLSNKGVKIVVDATKDLLVNTLKYHPFLIKPNNKELGEIFKVTLDTSEEILPYAKKLRKMGARNVIVSMSKDGAMLLTEDDKCYYSKPPKGKMVNTVGAGDSFVAGFLAGYINTSDYEKAFYTGLCTGSASAYSEKLATEEEVRRLLDSIGKSYY